MPAIVILCLRAGETDYRGSCRDSDVQGGRAVQIQRQVQLYIKRGVRAFGKIVNAVRVRDKKPRLKPPIPPCADCGKPIQAAMGRSAEYMAEYTARKYGAPLCAACASIKEKNQAEVVQKRTTLPENSPIDREEAAPGENAPNSDGGELL